MRIIGGGAHVVPRSVDAGPMEHCNVRALFTLLPITDPALCGRVKRSVSLSGPVLARTPVWGLVAVTALFMREERV